MTRRPLLISHRTQMGTSPENTLAGIRAAIAGGVDGIEVDVRASRDGVPVLLHDTMLSRTTEDPRPLAEVSASGARRLRVRGPSGTPGEEGVPSLAAALREVAGRCTIVLELKEPGLGSAVGRTVRAARAASWCWVWSFLPEAVEESRAVMPEVPASLLVAPGLPLPAAFEWAVRAGCAGVSLHHSLADAEAVRSAHARGLSVYTWTVNEVPRARALVAADIDAVCSDFPARLERTVRR